MKHIIKNLLVATVTLFSLSGCLKDEEPFDHAAQWEAEKVLIKTQANQNYPNMVEDDKKRGIYYEILEEGTPGSFTYKNEYPTITVDYKLSLLNGTVIPQNLPADGFKSNLGQLVPSWIIAFFPKTIAGTEFSGLTESGLQKGAKIRFITPSYYAYGNRASGPIPANSPLIFEITVLDITY